MRVLQVARGFLLFFILPVGDQTLAVFVGGTFLRLVRARLFARKSLGLSGDDVTIVDGSKLLPRQKPSPWLLTASSC